MDSQARIFCGEGETECAHQCGIISIHKKQAVDEQLHGKVRYQQPPAASKVLVFLGVFHIFLRLLHPLDSDCEFVCIGSIN
jgi:hypothetical protein